MINESLQYGMGKEFTCIIFYTIKRVFPIEIELQVRRCQDSTTRSISTTICARSSPSIMQATPLLLPVFMLLQFGLCSAGYEPPFGCNGAALTDRVRDLILTRINTIRALLAQGKYEPLASSSDMNKLKWDCNLESIAEKVVQDCPEQIFTNISQGHAINFKYYGQNERVNQFPNPIFESIEKWKKIILPIDSYTNLSDEARRFRDFSNMLNADFAAVGCYSTFCVDRASTACVFSHPAAQDGARVYTPGNPCVSGGNCNSPKVGACESGLCVIAA
ncbi:hypothetical protein KIN20_005795 [Parelaphostrongylus tenuis]|uniref:SCP domain-containing protein n=1 Tax=Parelaphostrongylus tenuis TaxID=148309 RepID=A0AAD5QFF7_PARTN|nr:hypothetical protein KIN20_005795 [Parelaphostrongylus tenuis]